MTTASAYLLCIVLIAAADGDGGSAEKCRVRQGMLDLETYRLDTCGNCFYYLYPANDNLAKVGSFLPLIYRTREFNTSDPLRHSVLPDIHNRSHVDEVCRALNSDECTSWISCCESAERCCESQLAWQTDAAAAAAAGGDAAAAAGVVVAVTHGYGGDGEPRSGGKCPATWDGYACWAESQPDDVHFKSCPSFIPHAMPSDNAYKVCTGNGTWYKDPESSMEWTNYTTCLDLSDFKVDVWVSIGCNALSLVVLIPSIIIFLYYRTLRSQNRIQIHIQLFASFILFAVITILWDTLVVLDRMHNAPSETRMHQNTIGCKLLYIMTRYSRSTNFLWMFVEACYLHRLIVKAFEPPKSLWILYVLAWGFPWLPVSIYSILRHFYADESCWVQHFGGWEWLIYIPNLISLAANLFFLIDILRILLTQLQSHPNEPSNYRRALKATFILVPLFGLQLFLIIYRPPYDAPGGRFYELVSSIITNSQGFFVALIFCLLNGEVLEKLKRSCKCERAGYGAWRHESKKSANYTLTSHVDTYTRDEGNGSVENRNSYIPMTTVNAASSQNGEQGQLLKS